MLAAVLGAVAEGVGGATSSAAVAVIAGGATLGGEALLTLLVSSGVGPRVADALASAATLLERCIMSAVAPAPADSTKMTPAAINNGLFAAAVGGRVAANAGAGPVWAGDGAPSAPVTARAAGVSTWVCGVNADAAANGGLASPSTSANAAHSSEARAKRCPGVRCVALKNHASKPGGSPLPARAARALGLSGAPLQV